jgi:hypothetical protein
VDGKQASLIPGKSISHTDVSKKLYNNANLNKTPLQSWGPEAPSNKNKPTYRRFQTGRPDKATETADASAVIGVWTPSTGWNLYAQKLQCAEEDNRDTWHCVQVWKLGPSGAEQLWDIYTGWAI